MEALELGGDVERNPWRKFAVTGASSSGVDYRATELQSKLLRRTSERAEEWESKRSPSALLSLVVRCTSRRPTTSVHQLSQHLSSSLGLPLDHHCTRSTAPPLEQQQQ